MKDSQTLTKTTRSSRIKNAIGNSKLKNIVKPNINTSKILMLTTFPPRECGIATYSQDLIGSLNEVFGDSFKVEICHLYDSNHVLDLSEKNTYRLNTDNQESYQNLATQINEDRDMKLVMIQHEFGLFNGCDEKFINFLKSVKIPIVIGFHTVMPSPDQTFYDHVRAIAAHVNKITVMTQSSKNILVETYGLSASQIEVITHGTHLIKHKNKSRLKRKYGLEGRTVLSTFGLLGPGKSIETTLNALPEIVALFPKVKFLILGKTHPTLVKNEGESYRTSLEERIKALDLEHHVEFVNEFLPLEKLLEYLQLTNIYVFSSNDPNQAVSGTFSYAMSCGCPIISTPIPHAKEFLSENKGLLFDFGDSKMLAKQLKVLLKDKQYRKNLGLNGLHASSATSWENSALLHGHLFEKLDSNIKLNYKKPEIKLDHLNKMTTQVGVIQFAKLNQPDIKSGYTLDDNARALIAVCQFYKETKDEDVLENLKTYLCFILNCQRFDGTFLNYVDENEQFTNQNDDVNLDDSNGRAIWALGEFLNIENLLPPEFIKFCEKTRECMTDFLANVEHINSPRAISFIIKGLQPSHKATTHAQYIYAINLLGTKLLNMYQHESEENWEWPEPYLTYGNSVIPEALLKVYQLTKKEAFKEAAFKTFNFLLNHLFIDGKFNVISNQSWFSKGTELQDCPIGGQQPIDVAYTIIALKNFNEVFPNEGYLDKMEQAFNWFLGENHLKQIIYNPCTAGCFDGLENTNVNLNQGAESTISYLMARLAFEC